MNSRYEKLLEQSIDRELKTLGDLQAPAEIQASVLAAIASRHRLPVQSPRPWPLWARAVLFIVLTASFAGVWYGLANVSIPSPVNELGQRAGGVLSVVSLLFGMLQTVGAALWIGITKLGTPALVGLITAALLGYFLTVALGTLWYRFVFDFNHGTTPERPL